MDSKILSGEEFKKKNVPISIFFKSETLIK